MFLNIFNNNDDDEDNEEEYTLEELDDYYRGTTEENIYELMGDEFGISEQTIWFCMTGNSVDEHGTPKTAYGFAKCLRLLNKFPQYRNRLSEVSSIFPEWKAIIDNWSELEKRYKTIKSEEDEKAFEEYLKELNKQSKVWKKEQKNHKINISKSGGNISKNKCPCGSGKLYSECCGK